MAFMDKAKILLVEDELSLLKANAVFFKEQGYEVFTANTIEAARRTLCKMPPDLVVLDVMLPDGSGFDFCREVRQQSSAPVIFLTALGDVNDEEQGFALGGDDYLIKPYDMNRLGIRVAAVLRRTTAQSTGRAEIPPLYVDPGAGQCVLNGRNIILSPMELRLLHYFMKNPNKMIHRSKVYEDVWGASPSAVTNTVVEHVYRLRKKLGMTEADSYFQISSEKQDYMFSKIRY
jgi:DNA-binding response OmpR family regulator